MNRHARNERRKGLHTAMTNAEASVTGQTAAVAAQGAHVASEKASSEKGPTRKKAAPKGHTAAKGKTKPAAQKEAKPKKAAKPARTKETGTLRPESKGAKVLDLISRAKGASLAELMKATGWQAHSVRGFISGTLGTRMGLKVAFAKREDGERVYSLSR
jgi:Protein of unknown function (DUF3489)